jgi:hypothetical protein
LRRRVKKVETVLAALGEDEDDTILRELNCRKGYTTLNDEGITLSIEEAYALISWQVALLIRWVRLIALFGP